MFGAGVVARAVASFAAALLLLLAGGVVLPIGGSQLSAASASSLQQSGSQLHETPFVAGPSFGVGEVVYPSAHDFDTTAGIDTCMSLSVPPGDTFTLSLEWQPLYGDLTDAGDLDLYIYLDSACTESALLTSSFNSNVYTGELIEVSPQVRNVGSIPAVAGIRVGKRSGRGGPGQIRLQVLTGAATFLEHGTYGPPLTGQEGAPIFQVIGPFNVPENSPAGTLVGVVTASDPQSQPLTFFELEPAAGQTSFQVDPQTGEITVEDPAALDRETSAALMYWIGVTDGASASLTSVGINLSGVNDNPPVALPASAVTAPGVPVIIEIAGTDPDIDPADQMSMDIETVPASGAAGIPISQGVNSSSVVYTPALDFLGTDTFTFVVNDGVTTSAPATVTVTVTDDPAALPSPPPEPGAEPTPTASPGATPTPGGGPEGDPGNGSGGSGGSGGGGPVPPAPVAPEPTAEAATPPSMPRSVRAEAGDSSVLITWQRPLSDGGAIEGYRIFNVNTARPTLIAGDVLEARVLGLDNDTSYLFQVQAFNSAGVGEAVLVGPVTPVAGSLETLDLSATVHPDDTVTVWWSAPEGDRLAPVAVYRLQSGDGDLLHSLRPGQPLIVTVDDLANDAEHAFSVSALDADGELVATGVSEPVYLPPTLKSSFDPPPLDAVTVPLADGARAELQLALQEAAGGEGTVADVPMVLTLRDGEAEAFVEVEGLHRALELPGDFVVESDQLAVRGMPGGPIGFDLQIADDVRLVGDANVLIDPSGILFRLMQAEMEVKHSLEPGAGPLADFTVVYSPESISAGFAAGAAVPVEMPLALEEALNEASGHALEVFEVTLAGMQFGESAAELIRVTADAEWHASLVEISSDLAVLRVGDAGDIDSAPLACAGETGSATVICSAMLPNSGAGTLYYAVLTSGSQQPAPPRPTPTPQPTVISAPSEPTPTAGPLLVVIEEPSPAPAPQPTSTPTVEPQLRPTSTPDAPVVPESNSGASIVTWLMSGILGLVVIRGAFYAVGRLKA